MTFTIYLKTGKIVRVVADVLTMTPLVNGDAMFNLENDGDPAYAVQVSRVITIEGAS